MNDKYGNTIRATVMSGPEMGSSLMPSLSGSGYLGLCQIFVFFFVGRHTCRKTIRSTAVVIVHQLCYNLKNH